jgi:hypothetical protein
MITMISFGRFLRRNLDFKQSYWLVTKQKVADGQPKKLVCIVYVLYLEGSK